MRFSALFQSRNPQQQPAGKATARPETPQPGPQPAAPAAELPEDLDARVRLVGEWQVSEY